MCINNLGKYAVYAFWVAIFLLTSTGCSLVQGTYYPLAKGAPSRDQAAEMTELTAEELEAQGYEQIGYITRVWNPEQKELFWDFRSDGYDLPNTDLFHKGFLSSLQQQAGKAGGDLLRREPDRSYQNENDVLVVNVEGTYWTEDPRSLEIKQLTWSVWRRKDALPSNS